MADIATHDGNAGDSAQSRDFAYDLADNMTRNTGLCGGNAMTYPAQGTGAAHPHAPDTICGSAVTYDANGNTLSYRAGGVTKTLAWDAENRLASVTTPGLAETCATGPKFQVSRHASQSGNFDAAATWCICNT